MNRRRALAAIGAATVPALAGCASVNPLAEDYPYPTGGLEVQTSDDVEAFESRVPYNRTDRTFEVETRYRTDTRGGSIFLVVRVPFDDKEDLGLRRRNDLGSSANDEDGGYISVGPADAGPLFPGDVEDYEAAVERRKLIAEVYTAEDPYRVGR